jgi:hypothetical protein
LSSDSSINVNRVFMVCKMIQESHWFTGNPHNQKQNLFPVKILIDSSLILTELRIYVVIRI